MITAVPGLRDVQSRLHDARFGRTCPAYDSTAEAVARYPAFCSCVAAGGMTVGAWILHEKGLALRLVAMRSGVLFLLTTAINVIVLALTGLGLGVGVFSGPHQLSLGLAPAAIAITGFIAVATADQWSPRTRPRSRLSQWITSTTATIRTTRELLLSGDLRLAGAVGYLLFDIAVLWACFRAFGAAPSLTAVIMGYQIGYLANLAPVPGGIGALEGGLTGALLLYGTPPSRTFAAVLVYHAIALWLPTIVGTLGFATLRRTLHNPLPPPVQARITRAARRMQADSSRHHPKKRPARTRRLGDPHR